ncbi:hypothetical protein ACUNI3_12245 [Serratia sp. IR-2025]|uniref:hypothetical protein n=1 Tax=Serratia nevei TaxID=2703794 RepID=UPI002AA0DBB9|nr:hypothetical protein [Serratia nevei]
MTLTTEQLRARAESLGLDFFIERRAGIWVKEWFNNGCTSATDEEVMMWSMLANREAQPVGYIDPDSLKEYRGQRAGGTWSAVKRTTSGLNMTTPIYTAPPAPAVPEEISYAIRHLKDTLVACNRFNYCADAVKRVENACRAAMLAAAPEGGNS